MKKILLFCCTIALMATTGCFIVPGRGPGWHRRADNDGATNSVATNNVATPAVAASAPPAAPSAPAVAPSAPAVIAP